MMRRDGHGWSFGYYPKHDTDWQLTLCKVNGYAVFLDFGKGGTRHDWRIRWTLSGFFPLLAEREAWDSWRTFGRLGILNAA